MTRFRRTSAPLIVVVDDDDETRETVSDVLRDRGYRVVSAWNGDEALELLQSRDLPHLILVDLWMPGMDGWQLRHAVKSDARLSSVPVVVMTAAPGQNRELLDVAEVIAKPFDVAELLAVVERYRKAS